MTGALYDTLRPIVLRLLFAVVLDSYLRQREPNFHRTAQIVTEVLDGRHVIFA